MTDYFITGGTGSLGKALLEQLQNRSVAIYSRDEGKHAELRAENITNVIGDVRDFERLDYSINKLQPKYIIHAAALKRLDDMETAPSECIQTNIEGSHNVVKVARSCNSVERCILVSTDKACKPTNVYGATKFLAEKLFVDADSPGQTRFGAVRYGNVIASRGSFIPLWKQVLSNGGSVNLTHLMCTRYLFSLQNAASLVRNRLHDMLGGEIFVPLLDSYRIFDIYKTICNMLDINTHSHYQITGMRPGEKLHEDMISEHEALRTYWLTSKTLAILPETKQREYGYEIYKGKPLNSAYNLSEDLNLIASYI